MKDKHISHEIIEKVTAFLFDSDLVKFSKFTPDVTSSYELISRGRQIVELTKPELTESQVKDRDNLAHEAKESTNTPSNNFNHQIEVTT